MNDPSRFRRFAIGAVVTTSILTGCSSSGGGSTEVVDPVATTIRISPDPVAFSFVGESRNLTAQVLDQDGANFNATVSWSSSDDAVVSVNGMGLARAEGNGSAMITASAAGLQASLTIQVQQIARVVVVEQGNDQEAIAGNALSDTIVVRITDLGGAAVEGVEVSFEPDATAGTVSTGSVVTPADGRARTVWTLGAQFGPQLLFVSAGQAEATLNSFSRSATPIADLLFTSGLSLSRTDPTTLDSLTLTATVLNQGDLAAGAFRVQALVGGAELGFLDHPGLGIGADDEVALRIGGLPVGNQDVRLVLDPADALPELIESNNEVDGSVQVLLQAPVSVGTPATGLSAAPGAELHFVVDIPPGSDDALVIETTDASPSADDDLDLFVHEGNRPSFRAGYSDCISAGPTTAERCQVVFPEGRYHILLHAWQSAEFPRDGFSDVTLTLTLGNTIIPFDIELVFIERGTAEQDQAFEDAATRWTQLIVGDVPEQDFTGTSVPADWCFSGQPAINDVIDDVRIFVTIRAIDGGGGTLAQAGPCFLRGESDLPVFGTMTFDEVDLEALGDGMVDVVLHEMGHVLGLGTIWDDRGLLATPSLPNNPGADTHFRGEAARVAFDDARGDVVYPDEPGRHKVPVENRAGPGSGDAHWRESIMEDEVMTPFINTAEIQPLSAITVASMEDLGYGVDLTQADPYFVPVGASLSAVTSLQRGISLAGDVRVGPIAVVDAKGRIVEVRW